jgi:hypothetical protein
VAQTSISNPERNQHSLPSRIPKSSSRSREGHCFQLRARSLLNPKSKLSLLRCCGTYVKTKEYFGSSLRAIKEPCTNQQSGSTLLQWKINFLETAIRTQMLYQEVSRSYARATTRFYINYGVRRDYSSPGRMGSTSTTPCAAATHLPVARALRQPRRTPRVLVSRPQRLYLDYAARPGASAPRAARPGVTARRAARRGILRLRRASGCRDTSRGSSHGLSHCSSSTTSTTPRVWVPRHVARLVTPLVIDFFDHAARPGASTRHAAHRQLLRLAQARHRLLRLRRASGCLGSSRGLSRRSS